MRSIFTVLFLVIMVTWGCHRKPSVPTPPPAPASPVSAEAAPPAVTPSHIEPEPAPPDPPSEAKEIPEPGNLELGEMNFKAGNYRQSARAYEAFLRNNPESKDRDRAWFYLGLSHIQASDSSRDASKAEKAFRQLIKDFPDSIYKSQAAFILGLLAQVDKLRLDIKDRDERIKKLSEELQVLKEIDLQRRPSRPKE
jgi:tetratricopeptide (TPR) repeat protein